MKRWGAVERGRWDAFEQVSSRGSPGVVQVEPVYCATSRSSLMVENGNGFRSHRLTIAGSCGI